MVARSEPAESLMVIPVSEPDRYTAFALLLLVPVCGMLVTWPCQYVATAESTEPLKALASKAGAAAKTLSAILRVRLTSLLMPAVEPLPELEPPADVVASGVWVVLLPLASVVATGVVSVEPLPFELFEPLVPFMLAMVKACQGTRTVLPVLEPLVEPLLLPLASVVATGVSVVEAELLLELSEVEPLVEPVPLLADTTT